MVKINNFDGLEVKGTKKDLGWLSPDRKTIKFQMKTSNAEDGFDFQVSEQTTKVECSIEIDQFDHPERLHIGGSGASPPTSNFLMVLEREAEPEE